MSKITLFAAFKAIFRTSFIKACGIFNFHGELGSNKQFSLKIIVIDMSFCPRLPFFNAENTKLCPPEPIAAPTQEKKIDIH